MSNTRLLEYLEKNGKISKKDADTLRVDLAKSTRPEEAILVEKNIVDKEEIAKAKGDLFNIPYVDLKDINVDESVYNLIAGEKLRRFKAVPYAKAGHIIRVAMADPFDVQAIQALQQQLKEHGRVLPHVATHESINYILDRNVGQMISTEVSDALEDVQGPIKEIDVQDTESLDDMDVKNAPVARIVNSILQYAVKSEASDIHIEPREQDVRVRFRINGIMLEKLVLPKHLKPAIVARVKIISDMKIDEKRIPQDNRFQIDVAGHRVDIRVSTMPSIFGEKVVMRLLDTSGGIPQLEQTGMRGSAYQVYIEAVQATNGIVLVTGPTGSGKSHTLAATLQRLNNPKVNIITLENPVEIRVPGLTQVQINPAVGLTFASALRSVLRQDPDIVMVGEIRDNETASLAVEASLTGHLVLSTLHTNGAAAAVQRLVDMGVESYLLASTLKIAIAQRLPRRVCPHCRVIEPVSADRFQRIKDTLATVKNLDVFQYLSQFAQSDEGKKNGVKMPEVLPDGTKQIYMYKGQGCSRCADSGYKGRIGIFEVMKVSEKIEQLVTKDVTAAEIEKVAVSEGMMTMMQDGYLKALEGITTEEEVLRVSRE